MREKKVYEKITKFFLCSSLVVFEVYKKIKMIEKKKLKTKARRWTDLGGNTAKYLLEIRKLGEKKKKRK